MPSKRGLIQFSLSLGGTVAFEATVTIALYLKLLNHDLYFLSIAQWRPSRPELTSKKGLLSAQGCGAIVMPG